MAAACWVLLGARPVLATLLGWGTLVFVATTTLRLLYIFAGRRPVVPLADGEARPLPRYSVMVALYHEAEVVPALLDAIDALDYPAHLLQILLLVEHDDPQTTRACEAALRPGWEVVVVPPGTPRTKPRALNVGLPMVDGEFFTIYDAEDRPEPDQLVKAVREFERQPERVVALQARLDFYNSHQNALTKWFTCDYANHFGLYLRGVTARRHPVPLGGTSTHFRTEIVREVGGWDAWNVTEDCELGMRLAAAGYLTQLLESVTWEEAVPTFGSWIRQRSRWVKGYAQTALVLLRSPLRTGRAMGWRPYFAALGIVGGLPIVLVLQPIFWTLLIVYVVLRVSGADVHPIEAVFPEPLLTLGMVSLLVGNFVTLLAHVSEIHRERRYDLVGWALTVPLYWLLASVAAWKGVLQLVSRPHKWEKTQHGLAKGPEPAAPVPVPRSVPVPVVVQAVVSRPARAALMPIRVESPPTPGMELVLYQAKRPPGPSVRVMLATMLRGRLPRPTRRIRVLLVALSVVLTGLLTGRAGLRDLLKGRDALLGLLIDRVGLRGLFTARVGLRRLLAARVGPPGLLVSRLGLRRLPTGRAAGRRRRRLD